MQRLERVKTPEDPQDVIAELNDRSTRRSNALWERLGRPQQELETPQATYRRLRFAGLTAREAGTLVGHLHGLSTVQGGWAIEEVEHLLFVRELVRLGRMGS